MPHHELSPSLFVATIHSCRNAIATLLMIGSTLVAPSFSCAQQSGGSTSACGEVDVTPGPYDYRAHATTVPYSDGYVATARLLVPVSANVPAGGWPVVVYVHRLAASHLEEPGLRRRIASEGFAVWSYDVRGQGPSVGLAGNLGHPDAGCSFWGPREMQDLAEQLDFIASISPGSSLPTTLDAARLAVIGPSQGGAHAWSAAALAGQTLNLPGRSAVVMRRPLCVASIDYVADSPRDWLRGGLMWSRWFVDGFCDDFDPANPAAFLYRRDEPFYTAVRSAFLAQDAGVLLAQWSAEGRDVSMSQQQSDVPVFYSHAYHDDIDSPLIGLQALQALAPSVGRHVQLSTIGHGTPGNVPERRLRDRELVRWLRRFLLSEPNGIDAGPAYEMAELPLAEADRQNPCYPWGHVQSDDPLAPTQLTRLHLLTGGQLGAVPSATSSMSRVQHDISGTRFDPEWYLEDANHRTVASILGAAPLSEVEYATSPMAAEMALVAASTLRLRLTPQQQDWMLAALLSIDVPASAGNPAERVMLSSWAVRKDDSQPGVAEDVELQLPPVHARVPQGARLVLTLRNHWLREAPMTRRFELVPMFDPFTVDVSEGGVGGSSWIDLPLEVPAPSLACDQQYLDVAAPTPIQLHVRGGDALRNQLYFITMSASGRWPGTNYLNSTLPLNSDFMSVFVAGSVNQPPLHRFCDFLSSFSGESTATLDFSLLPPLPPNLYGRRLTLAAFVWDHYAPPSGRASNAVDLELR